MTGLYAALHDGRLTGCFATLVDKPLYVGLRVCHGLLAVLATRLAREARTGDISGRVAGTNGRIRIG